MDPAEQLMAESTRRGTEALYEHAHMCTAVVNDIDFEIWFGSDITWQGNDGRVHRLRVETQPAALADAPVDSLLNPA